MKSIEQQSQEMRKMMAESFDTLYLNLINFLNKLPLNNALRSHSYMNFDQGAYWAREAMRHMQFDLKDESIEKSEESTIAEIPIIAE